MGPSQPAESSVPQRSITFDVNLLIDRGCGTATSKDKINGSAIHADGNVPCLYVMMFAEMQRRNGYTRHTFLFCYLKNMKVLMTRARMVANCGLFDLLESMESRK